jgi:hypothetical protein
MSLLRHGDDHGVTAQAQHQTGALGLQMHDYAGLTSPSKWLATSLAAPSPATEPRRRNG